MFGKRLKELRGSRTQDEIADRMEISKARYSHYESERNQPDPEMLTKMAKLYKTSVDYILGLTDDRHPAYDYETDEELSAEDKELISKLLSLPKDKKELLRNVTEAFLNEKPSR